MFERKPFNYGDLDLIYKHGQVGVTKASVTIVFDNRDKKQSPVGFKEYTAISVTRQIGLGSTSKYLINGHRAQQQTVHNLFQSVQLNINNPNFLIMQGKITKVLNMKLMEILAMIEEAAGTRMFADRRDKAVRAMARKEIKLQELQELLEDEIEPKLKKLRKREPSWNFNISKTISRDWPASVELECTKKQRQSLQDSVERLRCEVGHLEDNTQPVRLQRDKKLSKCGKGRGLEEIVKKHVNELMRLDTVSELKNLDLNEERAKESAARKTVIELEAAFNDKTFLFDSAKATYDKAKENLTKQIQSVELREELLQTLQAGVTSRISSENSYQAQLRDAKRRATTATMEQEQANLKIEHLPSRVYR
ncbi:structural maintenance-chromosome 2 [Fusarium beomiforme]|uniref:Structural maintenance-chromosome 2 n=1 Tax=Fusarium beomiforme TaxID=44412 RepID=A0A9P5ALT5_9HYPO|nr:structural maintenance-chromosome 2 [Fusarium beomiforme]